MLAQFDFNLLKIGDLLVFLLVKVLKCRNPLQLVLNNLLELLLLDFAELELLVANRQVLIQVFDSGLQILVDFLKMAQLQVGLNILVVL